MTVLQHRDGSSPLALGSVNVLIEVLSARDLVAKDRNLLRKKAASDPFVKIYYNGSKVGRTRAIRKTVSPVWNEKIEVLIDADYSVLNDGVDFLLVVADHDMVKPSDPMGVVQLHVDALQTQPVQGWYPIRTGENTKYYCENATGELQLIVSVSARCIPNLKAGNGLIPEILHPWNIKLSYDRQYPSNLQCCCVAIDNDTQEWKLDETVYWGNAFRNASGSISSLAGETNGQGLCIQWARLRRNMSYFFVIGSPFTSKSLDVYVRIYPKQQKLAAHELRHKLDSSFLVLFRAHYSGETWRLQVLNESRINHSKHFGDALPELRSLIPGASSGNQGRVALLQPDDCIFINDYVSSPKACAIRATVDWKLERRQPHDMDLLAIAMDSSYSVVETFSFRHLVSSNYAIQHGGDTRRNQECKEWIQFVLHDIEPNVHLLALVLHSYSEQSLIISQLGIHIEEKDSARIACHEYIGSLQLNPSFLIGCFARDATEWIFQLWARPCEESYVEALHALQKETNSEKVVRPPKVFKRVSLPNHVQMMNVEHERAIPGHLYSRITVEAEIDLS